MALRTQSIHPRVEGNTRHTKVATIKNPDKARIARVAARMDRHLEEHPLDQASKVHLAKLRSKL